MKKPINGFACALWGLAALYLIGDIPLGVQFARLFNDSMTTFGHNGATPGSMMYLWSGIHGALQGSGALVGIGVLIELVDQVCWNGLPESNRTTTRGVRWL